jgi:hypothetical protein
MRPRRSSRQNARGLHRKVGGRACWRCKARMANGKAARCSRTENGTGASSSHGRRRRTCLFSSRNSGLIPAMRRCGARWRGYETIVAGNTRVRRFATARSSHVSMAWWSHLALTSDRIVDGVVNRLVKEQLEDGGWNCEAENGSVHSSFHTTIRVLEGLLGHECATGRTTESIAVRRRAEEYLLERKLFRRLSTGAVVDPAWLQFSFPTRWHYDVLRALEYFRSMGDAPDPRMDEAIDLLRSKQRPDGTWLLENTHPGAAHFAFDEGGGRPSRWNTLRALRVLRWCEQ